jgi:tRNA(fMet)-specific endonuclease VapC
MNFILDTNVISELISRHPNEQVLTWVRNVDENRMYLSVITLGEIKKGIEKLPNSERRAELEAWIENDLLARFEGRIIALDTQIMLMWGGLSSRLELAGRKLPAIDGLLAATALAGSYILVTRNTSDFTGTGVQTYNPWELESLTP